jgi:hypothetical protein
VSDKKENLVIMVVHKVIQEKKDKRVFKEKKDKRVFKDIKEKSGLEYKVMMVYKVLMDQ